MNIWQPIETAPPDTRVLVFGSNDAQWAVARYTHEDGWEMETPHDWVMIDPPTHWQSLPAPPLGKAADHE